MTTAQDTATSKRPITSTPTVPRRRVANEVMFDNKGAMRRAMKVLIKEGFEVRWLDGRFDPLGGPTVWLRSRTATDVDYDAFDNYVTILTDELDGMVLESIMDPVSDAELALWENDTAAELADHKPH